MYITPYAVLAVITEANSLLRRKRLNIQKRQVLRPLTAVM
jgi:hypothetical protein